MDDFKYHIKTNSHVDMIFMYVKDTIIESTKPVPGAKDEFIFNFDIPRTFIEQKPLKTVCSLLGYGAAGGTVEYKINHLLSIPINPDMPAAVAAIGKQTGKIANVSIIINSPFQVRYVIIEFPADIVDLLRLPNKYSHLVHLEVDSLKKKHTNPELLKRGIDPQGKSWITELQMHIDDPSPKAMSSLEKIVSEYLIIVHCFSYGRLEPISITF